VTVQPVLRLADGLLYAVDVSADVPTGAAATRWSRGGLDLRTALHAGRLVVGVHEAALVSDLDLSILGRLRSFGVRLLLDDVGTALALAELLPLVGMFSLVRIPSALTALAGSNDGGALLNGLITFLHGTGAAVVAAGVVTATQVNQLRALDCDLAQGTAFERPAKASPASRNGEPYVIWSPPACPGDLLGALSTLCQKTAGGTA
jgi:EAL domain-containing protein (putative c-di-GMP-specific phosphodiesterase class I)